jgi:hypothetical protein
MEYLNQQGWDIVVLDVSKIVHPEAYVEITTGLLDDTFLKRFDRKKAYREYVKSINKPVMFIFTEDFNLGTRFLYTSLKKQHHYGYLSRQDTNVEYYAEHKDEALKKYLCDLTLSKIFRSFYVRIPRKLLFLKTADFHILGGSKNRELYIRLALTNKNTRITHLHSLDYEAFLDVYNDNDRQVNGKYWVFIDEYLPFHPDAQHPDFKNEPILDPKLYYQELRDFFHFIEDSLHVRVIIASHPRGDYGKHPEAYEGFSVFRFLTNKLIKDSEVVLSHFSTCEGYAALFQKPIIHILTTGILKNERYQNALNYYSEMFGSKILNISNQDYKNLDFKELCVIDENKYENMIRLFYKADYSKSQSDFESMFPKLEKIINESMAQ